MYLFYNYILYFCILMIKPFRYNFKNLTLVHLQTLLKQISIKFTTFTTLRIQNTIELKYQCHCYLSINSINYLIGDTCQLSSHKKRLKLVFGFHNQNHHSNVCAQIFKTILNATSKKKKKKSCNNY